MFGFLKKKKEEVKEKEHFSIFSTDILPALPSRGALLKKIASAIPRTVYDDQILVTGTMDSADDAALKNPITYNESIPDAQLLWYAGQSFIGYQNCALLSQNWLVNKACSVPAEDAVRNGYEITSNDGNELDEKIIDKIYKLDKKYKINKEMTEFVRNGKIFGIRIAMFDIETDDDEYYEKPYNPDGVTQGSYKGISQIDPYWMTPILESKDTNNPASRNFYDPTYWQISGVGKVHRSHLIIVRNSEVPDLLKPSYYYGGMPLTQMIAERVYAAERTANEGPQLAMSKRVNAYKLDTAGMVGMQGEVEEKLQRWAQMRDNHGIKIIGTDEDMIQLETSLTGFDDTVMTQYQLVSAVARVPATKLLGTSPKGFSSTGDNETKNYHEELESIQENWMMPLIDRHHELLIRSEFGVAFEIETVFNPVNVVSAKEKAEINFLNSQTDVNLMNAGAIDGGVIQKRLINDEESGYNGMEADFEDFDPKKYQEMINGSNGNEE